MFIPCKNKVIEPLKLARALLLLLTSMRKPVYGDAAMHITKARLSMLLVLSLACSEMPNHFVLGRPNAGAQSPEYRSGRESLCQHTPPSGKQMPARRSDTGIQTSGYRAERVITYKAADRGPPLSHSVPNSLVLSLLQSNFRGGIPMVKTLSTMLDLGTSSPDFSLPDVVSGQLISLNTFAGKKALLVMFICRHCPFVKHIQQELARIGKDYFDKDVGIVAISSNDAASFPEDSPSSLKQMAEELDFRFPFCYDESQETAKAYQAACTPDFYLFNEARELVYRGQLDDSRPGNDIPVTGKDLRGALDAVLREEPVSREQRPSIGCNIKWKAGNEPEYHAK